MAGTDNSRVSFADSAIRLFYGSLFPPTYFDEKTGQPVDIENQIMLIAAYMNQKIEEIERLPTKRRNEWYEVALMRLKREDLIIELLMKSITTRI